MKPQPSMKLMGFPLKLPAILLDLLKYSTLSPPVFHNCAPQLSPRTKEMIGVTVFSISLKTVHKECHCRCPGEVNISHTHTGAQWHWAFILSRNSS